jgi:hypothetical protein
MQENQRSSRVLNSFFFQLYGEKRTKKRTYLWKVEDRSLEARKQALPTEPISTPELTERTFFRLLVEGAYLSRNRFFVAGRDNSSRISSPVERKRAEGVRYSRREVVYDDPYVSGGLTRNLPGVDEFHGRSAGDVAAKRRLVRVIDRGAPEAVESSDGPIEDEPIGGLTKIGGATTDAGSDESKSDKNASWRVIGGFSGRMSGG